MLSLAANIVASAGRYRVLARKGERTSIKWLFWVKTIRPLFVRHREVSRQWPTGEDIVPRCLLPDDADAENSATWCNFRLWVKNRPLGGPKKTSSRNLDVFFVKFVYSFVCIYI